MKEVCDAGSVNVRVVFLQPNSKSALLNRVVAKLTGGYSHVELNFPEASRAGRNAAWFTTSIHSNDSVFVRPDKTFSNPGV